ncbi:MAG: hypothetical protein LBR36_07795 [Bacteroidales bacterium]|nr:hypothetical protein [Bacteroidales bacterium]
MKRKVIFSMLCILLIMSNVEVYSQPRTAKESQTVSPPRTAYGEPQGHHIIKLDVTNLIEDDLSAIYEYQFKKVAGLEAGMGILLPYYVNINFWDAFAKLRNPNFSFSPQKIGFSMQACVNFYIRNVWSPYGGYISPMMRYRMYSGVNVVDMGIRWGATLVFFDHLSVDLGGKTYYTSQKSVDGSTYFFAPSNSSFDMKFAITVDVRIGYRF